MKCPTCGEELQLTPMSMTLSKKGQKHNYCFKCKKLYTDRELKDISDAEMIEEDTSIWKEAQKFR